MKYQKKPVTVEAFQWNSGVKELPEWLAKQGNVDIFKDGLRIKYEHSWNFVTTGDYVLKTNEGIKIAGRRYFEERYIKVNDTDRISPDDIGNDIEETIEIVPDMKWFVRSKEKYEADIVQGLPESGYLYLTDGGSYDIEYCEMTTFKDDAQQFDTKEEAEKWTNPLTEAVQLPVEGE